jgi:glycosyltransferase involved in cell wall biosynthesis
MDKKHTIIAAIPALDEERTIAKVVIKSMKHVDRVVVCDDGSKDMTGEIAERLGAEVIRHDRNMGYGAALASLFRRAREIGADAMVTLDADMQHNPEDIPRLVKPILDGEADIVVGSRLLHEHGEEIPKSRRFGIKTITKLANAASYKELTDAQSGFRAYSRKAIELITPTELGMGASTEILLKAKENGLRIKEVPIKVSYNVEKPSTHNPLYHGLDVVLSMVKHMSIRHPLLVYGVPGIIALLTAIAFWVWTFQIFAATRQVVTNIALVAIGATIVGLMLLTTAVILWVLVSVVREAK